MAEKASFWPRAKAAVTVATALSFTGCAEDSSINLGFFQTGSDCAKLKESREMRNPATSYQLENNIRTLAEVCGFCATNVNINIEGVAYAVCVDPESLRLTGRSAATGDTAVKGYLGTVPETDTVGAIHRAMEANPGVCASTIVELNDKMSKMFGVVFSEQLASTLVPDIDITPDSELPCATGSQITS